MAVTLNQRGGLNDDFPLGGSLTTLALEVSASAFSHDGYPYAEVQFTGDFSVAPVADTLINVWFLRTIDNTNYEDGSATVIPRRTPDVTFPMRAVTTAQRVIKTATMPPGRFKILVQNGTGQTLSANWTLYFKPFTTGPRV